MTNSTAPLARHLFAQQCDNKKCHISFKTISGGQPLNIQMDRWDLKRFIANLIAVDKSMDENHPMSTEEQQHEKNIWFPDKKPY